MKIQLSKHARKRMQQRAIPQAMLSIVHQYGWSEPSGKGTTCHRISKRALVKLRQDLKSVLGHLDSLQNSYFIAGEDGSVVTVGHRVERLKIR